MRVLFLLVMLASAIAGAESKRVLVADPDAELVQAIEWTLQPWKMVVVAEPAIDPALVSTRAIDANAQFVVWRDAAGDLVVYDRERGVTERRPARTGAMDPVSAASAALTVKTMMRLPEPVEEEPGPEATSSIGVVTPTPVDDHDVVRIEAGIAVDTRTALGGRFGAMYRPAALPLRIGGVFELASLELQRSGFRGNAHDYSLFAVASWVIPIGRFELEPWIAAGAMVDVVDGQHAQEMRHETAVVPTGRAGLAFWWWLPQQWGIAITASANVALGTPTYTRDPNSPSQAVIYDMPSIAGTFGLVAAWRR